MVQFDNVDKRSTEEREVLLREKCERRVCRERVSDEGVDLEGRVTSSLNDGRRPALLRFEGNIDSSFTSSRRSTEKFCSRSFEFRLELPCVCIP